MSRIAALVLVPVLAAGLYWQPGGSLAEDKPSDDGFTPIFDGKTLTGWKVSAKTGHSGASKNKSGGKWEVVDGAIVGSQDIPGNGGIIITSDGASTISTVTDLRMRIVLPRKGVT